MINQAILIGRLGSDPELKYLTSGTAVVNFSVATSKTWKSKDSEQKSQTQWHRVVAFNRLAEICGEYLNKGKLVYITGEIQYRNYEDSNGDKKYITEIIASNMQMLGDKGDSAPPKEEGIPDDSSIPPF